MHFDLPGFRMLTRGSRRLVSTSVGVIILAVLTTAPGSTAEKAEAELLSGPYVIALTTEGGTICWQTTEDVPGAVRFRAEKAADWTEIGEPKPAQFHAVKLTGLAPGTEHRVEVLSIGAKLAELAFQTAPKQADRFTFFVYGDTRTHADAHGRVAAALLAEATRLRQFTFVVHTGDLAQNGSNAEETARQFFGPAALLLARLPVVPVRGNHEEGTDLFKKYFPAPDLPRSSDEADDLCFDYGSARIIVLDQYVPARTGDARMKWLAEKLAEAKDRWRVVVFHEPVYSSGAHGPNVTFRELAEPVLVAGKVHLVVAGHDHDYERTKPLQGITHIVSGGGGAPLRGKRWDAGNEPWSAKFESVHNFLTVTVTPEKLTVTAFKPAEQGESFGLLDSVEIPRDCGWPEESRAGAVASPETCYDHGNSGHRRKRFLLMIGAAMLLGIAVTAGIVLRARRRGALAHRPPRPESAEQTTGRSQHQEPGDKP